MSIYCPNCHKETKNPKFCSRSCSASFNNRGVRRHGLPKSLCFLCKKETKSAQRKFCSRECRGIHSDSLSSPLERKLKNRFYFMSYYLKKLKQTPPDADMAKIKEIYMNCPVGFEVDHIIPISKGGQHHQDNLQYLTISENRSKGNKLNWRGW